MTAQRPVEGGLALAFRHGGAIVLACLLGLLLFCAGSCGA